MKSYSKYPFASGFSHSAECFCDFAMLEHVSITRFLFITTPDDYAVACLSILLSMDNLRYFWVLPITNKTAAFSHETFWGSVFSLLVGKVLGAGWTGHLASTWLTFFLEKWLEQLPKWLYHSVLPPTPCEHSSSSASLPAFGIIGLFQIPHSARSVKTCWTWKDGGIQAPRAPELQTLPEPHYSCQRWVVLWQSQWTVMPPRVESQL